MFVCICVNIFENVTNERRKNRTVNPIAIKFSEKIFFLFSNSNSDAQTHRPFDMFVCDQNMFSNVTNERQKCRSVNPKTIEFSEKIFFFSCGAIEIIAEQINKNQATFYKH